LILLGFYSYDEKDKIDSFKLVAKSELLPDVAVMIRLHAAQSTWR